MKKVFEHLDSEKSKEFLRYFKAAIRNPDSGMIQGDGRASHNEGRYESEQAATFEYGGHRLFVNWKIVQGSSGQLISIENINPLDDSGGLDELLNQLVSEILEMVISEKKEDFFIRSYLTAICGADLPGEYWIDGFRLAPLFSEEDCWLHSAERLVVIDQTVQAVDHGHAQEVAKSKANIIASRLSFILDVGFDEPVHEDRYFLKKENAKYSMCRGSTQLIDTSLPSQMPAKGELCEHVSFEGSIFDKDGSSGQPLDCPQETRRLFKQISLADAQVRNAFDSACRMYQLSLVLGRYKPTVRTAYQCGAIDAIVQSNTGKHNSFTDFMTTYSEASREICDLIYSKIRSAHWHAGSLFFREHEHSSDPIFDPTAIPIFSLKLEIRRHLRNAIINWLDDEIGFASN